MYLLLCSFIPSFSNHYTFHCSSPYPVRYTTGPVYTTDQPYRCSTLLTMPINKSDEAPSARILRELGKENATLEQRLGVLVRANRHPEIYHLSSLRLREIRETIKQYESLLVNP